MLKTGILRQKMENRQELSDDQLSAFLCLTVTAHSIARIKYFLLQWPSAGVFRAIIVEEDDASQHQEASTNKMTGLVLSIIMILGLAGGPTDFNDGCGTDNSAETVVSANQ